MWIVRVHNSKHLYGEYTMTENKITSDKQITRFLFKNKLNYHIDNIKATDKHFFFFLDTQREYNKLHYKVLKSSVGKYLSTIVLKYLLKYFFGT